MTIWVNTLVQNEDRYLWFALTSVIEYVDKALVWDTGSTDKTKEIIKQIQINWPDKIILKEVGMVNPTEFTEVRRQMLKETKSEWVMILDGDEVWWEDSIRNLLSVIKSEGGNLDSIVSRYVNLVGDIYHYQPENAGKYRIKGRSGFLTIRAMNKKRIKGLNIEKPHGRQGFYDGVGRLIQDRDESNMKFLDPPSFLHFTNLQRSGTRSDDLKVPKRGFKLKHEIGDGLPVDFYYPEVFFKPHPNIVESVWKNMDKQFYTRAIFETPLRKIKRSIIKGNSGY